MKNETLVIGKITKAHGIRGEVKVIPLTDDLKRFKKLKTVIIDDKEVIVEGVKLQSTKAILKLEGFNRIEDTAVLRDKYISVNREDAVELEEGEYYIADLIGCMVFDENGLQLGKIYDVISTGSNDVYWIKDQKKKDILVPVLKEIVLNVDIDSEKIIIKPIKEWMDE
ncbi:ribosome maturation factor RimM [Oceanirhabdus sp. W0125-5]|uniref:ribosome maturation factor RimM n=1 Tax=Oceanirhabdus sp. W0125-5 TaxID=2999116 RepID=UPI0022F32CE0|nr:ribosome maturation factor RimM [Oceanirhabdus sp. W0125-5]WBW94811.1 ribosome maturation factor RimM [Oceanirhabdus sp. W0125-5]